MVSEDVKIGGLNISALVKNFDVLKDIVLEQREIIKTQKKDIRLCFARIESLRKEVDKKQNDDAKQGMEFLF